MLPPPRYRDAYKKLTGTYDEAVTDAEVYDKLLEVMAQDAKELMADNASGQRFRYVETPLITAIRNGYLIEIQEPTVIAVRENHRFLYWRSRCNTGRGAPILQRLPLRLLSFPCLMDEAEKAAFILCDNLYRRIEGADTLPTAGIKLNIPRGAPILQRLPLRLLSFPCLQGRAS